MKKKEYFEKIYELKKKFGRSWHKKYKTKKNYPFGKKSVADYTIEERLSSKPKNN